MAQYSDLDINLQLENTERHLKQENIKLNELLERLLAEENDAALKLNYISNKISEIKDAFKIHNTNLLEESMSDIENQLNNTQIQISAVRKSIDHNINMIKSIIANYN
jgi:uncharacterized membrane protein (UPF0182 family)